MHLASLCGTVYVYQGELFSSLRDTGNMEEMQMTDPRPLFFLSGQELGQINVSADWLIDEFKDVGSKNLYNDHQVSAPSFILSQVSEDQTLKSDLLYLPIFQTKRRTIQGIQDVDMSDVVRALKNKSRDNARTPVQWSDEIHAGHSALPWMRIHE